MRCTACRHDNPEDLDVARARFDELRPDPMCIPPNAASRARDRTLEAWTVRDWAALRALPRGLDYRPKLPRAEDRC